MAIDKAFEQLKLAAIEVKARLIDIDENIHPSATEIEDLGKKVSELSEQIAVYKYLKNKKELSPSINLHLKVMEKTQEAANQTFQVNTTSEPLETIKETAVKQVPKKIELSLNDKFRMINELFKQSTTEFNLAVDQLNTIDDLEKSEIYLTELKNLYSWKDEHELCRRIFQLNRKRFL